MDKNYLNKLRDFRETVKAVAEADSDEMRKFAEATCDHISDCTASEKTSKSKALGILKDCLEKLKDSSHLSFQQMRTDILFALGLCIKIVEHSVETSRAQKP